jgi:ABC-2 type transport system ATP-binding protein
MPVTYSVQTEHLTRRFGAFTAVDDISIQVKQGEIIGFLGANGAGKTTLIRMLCGLLLPTSGTASVAGFALQTQSEQIKRNIGYMSQKFSLYEDLSVLENLQFYGGIYNLKGKTLQLAVEKEVQQLGLQEYLTMSTSALPLGIKQRLALGCSLLHKPPVLFLDEPTSGVDPRVRRSFWDIIYQQAESGKTIFVTTHFIDEAEYCNRVLIMQDGKAVAFEKPSILKQKLNLQSMNDVFLALITNKQKEAAHVFL